MLKQLTSLLAYVNECLEEVSKTFGRKPVEVRYSNSYGFHKDFKPDSVIEVEKKKHKTRTKTTTTTTATTATTTARKKEIKDTHEDQPQ